ncbi:MAG: Dihydrolipoyl dehydrogenase [Chlamydiae bacterium]|nr:Dihydrolipoyl dehydrogenase [Chlamydiota bacterium]
MAKEHFDLIVIGSGPAGYVAAIRAAQLGLKTAIIEKEKTLGGTCLNVGCIPSKALLYSSELYARLQHDGKEHGITCTKLTANFDQMMKRKRDVVKSLVDGVSGLMKKNKIAVFQGTGKFLGPTTIGIGKQELTANNILIATGSESISLTFLPFDEERVVSSTGALSLKKVPKRLVVIGAGVIGVELASVYGRLGSEVTIVEMLDHICPAMDSEVSKSLLKILTKQNMTFHLSSKVQEATVGKKEISLKLDASELKADVVLVSVGRRPYTSDLGLETIGLDTSPQGFIPIDGQFRTKIPHIYAVGDVVEGVMLAHKASEEGVAAVEIIAGHKPAVDYMTVPNVIYTHPEVAAVGLTEEEARNAGIEVMVGKYAFKGNGRARCSMETDGFVKIIGEKKRGLLIGMHIIGAQASELISEGMIAIQQRATVEDLAVVPQAHPTLSEVIKEAALNTLGRTIHA